MPPGFANLIIELTDEEKALVARIDFNPGGGSYNADSWGPIADAMENLMGSLIERDAIPPSRLKYFTEPEHFIGGHGRSRLQDFERHGTRGDDIFRHGNFVKYLRYLLYGPDLPVLVIEAFQGKVINCGKPFTSGDANGVADFARALARSRCIDKHKGPEEFYKLALDCDLDAGDAGAIRHRVMRVR